MSLVVPIPSWIRLIALAVGCVAVGIALVATAMIAVAGFVFVQRVIVFGPAEHTLPLILHDLFMAGLVDLSAVALAVVCYPFVSDWLMPAEEGIAA